MKGVLLVACFVCLVGTRLHSQREEEWLDPTDILHYDMSTKTMRRAPEHLAKEPIPQGVETCPGKPYILHKRIAELKELARDVKKHYGYSEDPESKLSRLLDVIEELNTPHDDDRGLDYHLVFLPKSWSCISMTWTIFAAWLWELAENERHNFSHLTPSAIITGIIFFMAVALKWIRIYQRHQEQPRVPDVPEAVQNGERQAGCHQEDPEYEHSMDPLINMSAETLMAEGGQREQFNDAGLREGPDKDTDECCDENFEIIKLPKPESQPATKYCCT